ncbi:MAG TPA: alanine racemase [Verrucomicrobiae bacterium]|nr:alanine racemase [Verrucomicrobiae bacterium]
MIRTHLHRLTKKLQRSYEVYNRIEISKSALTHNAEFFGQHSGLQIIPVLKGNAYGHGIQQVATALKGEWFAYIAVDGYFEALKVRAHNPRQPILVMGMIKPQNFPKLKFRQLAFVVQDEDTLHALGKLGKRVKIHLELNTGMNRYGVMPHELQKYIDLIQQYPKIQLEGIMAHLADPDGDDSQTIHAAVKLFDTSVEKILAAGLKPTLFHTAQTAGGPRAQSAYANAMRLGIGLYGINPFPPKHALHDTVRLRPALRLVSTISKVQQLEKGDKVSYNYTFTAPKAMRIGILPLGYHEGVSRALSNKGQVKIGSRFYPIVGRVCMNHTIVALGDENVHAGDEVVVYSNHSADQNSIDTIAVQHGLFSYSLLTDLSPDVRRYLIS